MSFDNIPEDEEQSFECAHCIGGNVVLREGVWQCDTCDWSAADESAHPQGEVVK